MGLLSKLTQNEKKGLNIIIVGCGTVGETLVERLSNEGHDITVIDKDRDRVLQVANTYDVMGLTGNGARYGILIDAGIENADVFIAVARHDELNLLCCAMASKVSDCATFARVHTAEYSSETKYFRDHLGITMVINPEFSTAEETSRLLYQPNALEVSSFAHGRAELVKFKIQEDNPLVDKTIAKIGREIPHELLICAIERDDEIIIPNGSDRVMAGDEISFMASKENVRKFFDHIGFNSRQVKDTLIVGGGTSGYSLAKLLLDMGISVRLIERDRDRCEELARMLPHAIIINGDGTSEALLNEEDLPRIESFIPLTGMDEENVLLALHAKKVNPEVKVVTKINRVGYRDVIKGMDMGSVIYPRYIIAEAIVSYVRGIMNSHGSSNVERLYRVLNDRVEAVEFRVTEESEITDKYLHELKLKENVLIASIGRKGTVIIPSGNDKIMVGDRVMIVTTNLGFDSINQILA
ncbi:MAG: Trk system potassium transporter TrkA [Eubacterium sp.]|nr:Trk system potassium transporter TrkA [Eubacterium sp.]